MKMTIPKQEKRFDYKGFPCVILFMPMGYRCGYVGLPKGMEIDTDCIACHGGITYGENHLHCQDDKDRFWIGFDCTHYGDGYDTETLKRMYAEDEDVIRQMEITKEYFETWKDTPYKTLDFCEEQCKCIVEQLIEMGIKPDNDLID